MDTILKEGQILIIRVTDKARYGKYESYAFIKGGDILAAVDNLKLIEMPADQGEFEVVSGGNLHPRRYDPNKHIFFSEQPRELQEQYRNRNVIDE